MFQCIPTHRENIWRRFLGFAAALHEKQASREAHAELTRLFERYGNAVFRAAYACLHNKSDAEDVMQDTFLQYLRTNPIFESAEHEKAWLLRVAMNASKIVCVRHGGAALRQGRGQHPLFHGRGRECL